MRYTVVLVPDPGWISVSVPAMPGCVSQGRTRDEALANVLGAIEGWMLTESQQGRGPLTETPALVSAEVAGALEIIEEMREAGEIPADHGYNLELATIELREPAIA